MADEKTISKYDDIRGALEMEKGAGAVIFAKPTTIKNVEPVRGRAETYIIETARRIEKGETVVFVEVIDETGVTTRVALPPKVTNAIARQREALSARVRSKVAKETAQARKDRGEVPGFMRGRKSAK